VEELAVGVVRLVGQKSPRGTEDVEVTDRDAEELEGKWDLSVTTH